MAKPDDEIIAERLLAENGDMVVVESKMVRGSTHDKDRTTFVAAVSKDDFSDDVQQLRDAQRADMLARRGFDPEQDDG